MLRITAESQMNQQLETTVLQQAQLISQLENKMHKLEQELRVKDGELTQQLNASRHIETGSLGCSDSDTWTAEPQGRSSNVVQKFSKEYSKPPIVYLALFYLHSNSNNQMSYYWVHLSHVDTRSFTMTCRRYMNSRYNHINAIQANWISFPSEL